MRLSEKQVSVLYSVFQWGVLLAALAGLSFFLIWATRFVAGG